MLSHSKSSAAACGMNECTSAFLPLLKGMPGKISAQIPLLCREFPGPLHIEYPSSGYSVSQKPDFFPLKYFLLWFVCSLLVCVSSIWQEAQWEQGPSYFVLHSSTVPGTEWSLMKSRWLDGWVHVTHMPVCSDSSMLLALCDPGAIKNNWEFRREWP